MGCSSQPTVKSNEPNANQANQANQSNQANQVNQSNQANQSNQTNQTNQANQSNQLNQREVIEKVNQDFINELENKKLFLQNSSQDSISKLKTIEQMWNQM